MSDERPTLSPRASRAVTGVGGAAAVLALAVPLIMAWEGDNGGVGYFDRIAQIPSYCYGGTGPNAVVGRHYTRAECRTQLADDVRRHADGIAPCIHVTVAPPVFAALISLSYNAGVAGVCRSSLMRKLNAGDVRGACAGFSAWVMSGHPPHRIRGLVNRRAAERRLCESAL